MPTVLDDLLAGLRAMCAPTLPEGIALEIRQEGLAEALLLDAGSLQDSLLNLILNARDAIGPGPGRIAIAARPVRDTWIEITVEDTGPGFSDAALEQALDPFFSTKRGAGSGLGLSMVYDQTRLSGGSVKLSNRPEGGACVRLRLPLRPAGQAAESRLVLLVEDTDEIRADVREMLRRLGHSVIEAATAEEALGLVDLPGIGLVLSDIGLPGGIDGIALARRLAGNSAAPPVRLMTSLPPGDARRGAAGDLPILTKPFGEADLAAFLAEHPE